MRVQYATVTEVNTLFIIFISPNTSARLCLEIINSLISLISNVNFVHNVFGGGGGVIKMDCKSQGDHNSFPFPYFPSLPFPPFPFPSNPPFPFPLMGSGGITPGKFFQMTDARIGEFQLILDIKSIYECTIDFMPGTFKFSGILL